jgi:hypothetical protein
LYIHRKIEWETVSISSCELKFSEEAASIIKDPAEDLTLTECSIVIEERWNVVRQS